MKEEGGGCVGKGVYKRRANGRKSPLDKEYAEKELRRDRVY